MEETGDLAREGARNMVVNCAAVGRGDRKAEAIAAADCRGWEPV
jgi:hypothetical protein